MVEIQGWGRALAAVLLLAGTVELLLPSGSMKGYARAFLGLLVLLAVLQPAVEVLRGGLRLTLPVPAASGLAAGPAAAAGPADATARTFEGLVASEAARVAAQVPGVERASVTLRFGAAAPGGNPPVVAAEASVTPAAAAGAGLGAQVAAALAAGLGVPRSDVQVAVL